MSTPANVQSLEAIDAVRNALATFIAQVADSLTELNGEMRRVKEWLEHDRPRYWRNQVRIATEQAHEAQQALHRCLMFPITNERPSCYEEREALKKAKARLVYCQEKQERLQHWQRSLQHELFEYEGRISQLVRMVDVEAPHAIGVLHKIVRHLEDYHSVRSVDPRAAYDELARQIWPEDDAASAEAGEGPASKDDVPAEADQQVEKA
jgi:exonuclease VII large subunit